MFGFFRPKWQHRNPQIRIEAINGQNLEKDLILKIAQTDQNVDVRITALRLISDLKVLYAIFLQEPSLEGREAVLTEIAVHLAKGESIEDSVAHFVENIVRRDFPISDLLIVSRDKELKQILFTKINLQKDLPRLIEINYPFSIHELLLVDDLTVLSDLVKKANITDKKVLAHLKESIQKQENKERKLLLKQELLARYIQLAEASQLPALNIFSALEKEWNENQLGDDNLPYKSIYLEKHNAHNEERQTQLQLLHLMEQHLQNVENVDYEIIVKNLESLSQSSVFSLKEKTQINILLQIAIEKSKALQKQNILEEQASVLINKAYNLLQQTDPVSVTQLNELKQAIAKLPNNYSGRVEVLNLLTQKIETPSELKEVKEVKVIATEKSIDRTQVQEKIQELEGLIEKGSLQAAEQLHKNIVVVLDGCGASKDVVNLQRLLKQVVQPLNDQLDTARWGIHQNLELLCEQAEKLLDESSTELVSVTLKQLRDNWNESKKGLSRVPYRLHQRFETACQKAHQRLVDERTQNNSARLVYIEEAQELLNSLSQYVGQIDWQAPNWPQLIETRQQFLQEWNRYLNQYSTDGALSYGAPLFLNKDKQKLERSMRQIFKPLETALQNERVNEKKRREDEIQLLQTLLEENKIREAVDKAKIFNKTFNPSVRSKRNDENLLWKQLRLVNDQIFALREEFVSAEENEKAQNAESKKRLLLALKELHQSLNTVDSMPLVEQKLAEINDQWIEVGVVSKRDYSKLENEFKTIQQSIKNELQAIDQARERQAREELLSVAVQIGELETKINQGEEIEIVESLYDSADANLRKRLKCLEQIQAGQESAKRYLTKKLEASQDLAMEIVLTKEILLDRASPEEDRELRLVLQVNILEEAMNNNLGEKDKTQQLKRLDENWLENVVGTISDSLSQRFR